MYKLTKNGVLRKADGAFIPLAEGNSDYAAFMAWQAAGNVPDPEDLPDPNAPILAQIASMEAATMVPRVVREFMLRTAEDYAERTATDTMSAAQILAADVAYQKVKAVDDQIKALRGKLK